MEGYCSLERLYLTTEGSHKGHSGNPQVVCLGKLSVELGKVHDSNHGLGNTDDEQIIGVGVESAQDIQAVRLRTCTASVSRERH